MIRLELALELDCDIAPPGDIDALPMARLPASVLSYNDPSRHCQSDRL